MAHALKLRLITTLTLLLRDVLTGQTSTSVQILSFQLGVTKNVTTSPVVSTACVKMASFSMTTSTAWVSLNPSTSTAYFVSLTLSFLLFYVYFSALYPLYEDTQLFYGPFGKNATPTECFAEPRHRVLFFLIYSYRWWNPAHFDTKTPAAVVLRAQTICYF